MNQSNFAKQNSYLDRLNPEQYEAVVHRDGPLLIFAGAGSGKTRVLTHRIAHLVLEHRVDPERIFAVTFTNKAAREMRERLISIFSDHGRVVRPPSWVSTFHSGCARMLRANARLLDFTPQFAIYDTSDSLSVMKRVFRKLNIDPKVLDPRRVLSRIDRAKNEYTFSDSIREDRYTPRAIAELMADAFDGYQEELRRSNAMDFGDLLCNMLTLFKLEPDLLARYQEHFQYLLIDEYQDTNRAQYLFIKALAAKHQNLCVVGDDDQSIYAFRGATIENILNFRKDFPTAKTITLDRNYRSTQNILTAANAVIRKNKRRERKTMRTDNPNGPMITCYSGYDEKEEADFITREISRLFREGVRASEIAVFYRTNSQSRAVEEAFHQNGIPYEIYGGQRFYDRKEIKDLLAYYRLSINPDDNEALLRVINTPARGLGPTSVASLIEYAQRKRLSLFPAIREALSEEATFLSTANKKKFAGFLELMDGLLLEAQRSEQTLQKRTSPEFGDAISVFLSRIANDSGYLADLKAQDTLEADSRIENIYELLSVASDYVRRSGSDGDPLTLSSFIERASLSSDLDKGDTVPLNDPVTQSSAAEQQESQKVSVKNGKVRRETVSLMTLHLAKGLEFDYVFLGGLEEGLLPHARSLEDQNDLEEERRLCYVGITRARKRLSLSWAQHRDFFGRHGFGVGGASRFLFDLPENIVENIGADD